MAKYIKTYILGARKARPKTYTKEVNKFLEMFDAMMIEHTYKNGKPYILGARKANPRTYTTEVNEILTMFDTMILEHAYKNGKTTIIVYDTKKNIPWFSFTV